MYLTPPQRKAVTWILLLTIAISLVNGIYLDMLAHISVPLFWFADFVQWIALPTLFLVFLSKKLSLLPKHYGFYISCLRWQSLIFGTLAVFVTMGLGFFLIRNLSWHLLGQPTGFFSLTDVFPSGIMGQIIWIYSALTAGIVESIFFIGLPWLLYLNTQNKPSRVVFTIGVSIIFAIVHWEQGPHIISSAFFSHVIACAWFFKLGTLWPIAAGHTLVDLIAFG